MPWQPGQSGNPEGGRLKARRFANILDRVLTQEDLRKEEDHRIRKGLEKLLEKIADGDLASIQFLADRTDGKPAQQLTIDGDMILRKAAQELTDDQLAEIINARSQSKA